MGTRVLAAIFLVLSLCGLSCRRDKNGADRLHQERSGAVVAQPFSGLVELDDADNVWPFPNVPTLRSPVFLAAAEGAVDFGEEMTATNQRLFISGSERMYIFRILSPELFELEAEITYPGAIGLGSSLAATDDLLMAAAVDDEPDAAQRIAYGLPGTGRVYIYARTSDKWELKERILSKRRGGEGFGSALVADGRRFLVSERHYRRSGIQLDLFEQTAEGMPRSEVLQSNDYWLTDKNAIALEGSTLVFGAESAKKSPVLLTFQWQDDSLTPKDSVETRCSDSNSPDTPSVVLLQKGQLIVSLGGNRKCIQFFEWQGNTWRRTGEVIPPILQISQPLHLALEGESLIVGHPGIMGSNWMPAGSRAYEYRQRGETWELKRAFYSPGVGGVSRFGAAVALNSTQIFVSSPEEGRVYVFPR